MIASFALGSLPFGYWIALARGVDIRKVGSGNVGATNVFRVLGPKLGLTVFVLDVAKGLAPAWLGSVLLNSSEWALAAGVCAVAGHCLSPFLGFRGGKGIATGLGAVIGASPLVAGVAFVIFVATLIATRYVSVSSLAAAASIAPLGLLFHDPPILVTAYVGLALFVTYRHIPNIKRLREGTENRFYWRGNRAEAPPQQSNSQDDRST